VIVAFGTFWAAWRQSNFNAAIREKNEEIARLQHEAAAAITGGDSFAWVAFSIVAANGSPVNAFAMPEDLLLVPNFHHVGKYPLYGRSARFADVRRGRPFDLNSAIKSYPVGDLTPGLAATSGIRLPQHAPSAAALLRGGPTAVIAQDQHRARITRLCHGPRRCLLGLSREGNARALGVGELEDPQVVELARQLRR
jgi:hypothetical protein